MNYDVIIVGGGASGLFCARAAGQRGRRVLVLEHQARLGNKILISGGGRCNFTNLGATAANFVTSGSPNFLKSALARCGPRDFLALLEQHGIAWHEREHRQVFCNESAKQIVRMLQAECAQAGVDIRLGCQVLRREDSEEWMVERLGGRADSLSGRFRISTTAGVFAGHSVVVATGGLSYPRLGATSFGYDLARQFGLKLASLRPGLVPLRWSPADREAFSGLSGISFDCMTGLPGGSPSFREAVLFTHSGLSGPAILQISSYWRPGQGVLLNLLPDRSALDLLATNRAGGREVRTALRQVLPERFAQAWCARHAPALPIAQLSRVQLEALSQTLHRWEILPAGDEGYAKAEVTVGGVETGELSSKTLECRRVPGLHFVGEVVDVTGWLGGYNFQWAWASGHAAGQAV